MTGQVQTPGGKSWSNMIVGSWVDDASCQGCDPDVFYPPEVAGKRTRSERIEAETAKLICSECPVQVDCLRYALSHAEPWGIWGGTTPAERRALMQGPRPLPPIPEMDHGKEAGNIAHRRRGEKPCRACLAASALTRRERREVRR